MLPSASTLAKALVKISASMPTHQERVQAHHDALEKDWKLFEKGLKSQRFQKAALQHPETDSKLKRYIKNFGGYLTSKNVVGVVPSRTHSKMYKVKELPNGRLACNCKDWQYHHSVRRSDCDHIRELKKGLVKSSSAYSILGRGIAISRAVEKAQNIKHRGEVAEENVRRLYTGEPFIPLNH